MVDKTSLNKTGFKVIDSFGKQVSGKLDGNGFAQVTGIAPGPAKVEFETDPRSAWDKASHFNRDYTWSGRSGRWCHKLCTKYIKFSGTKYDVSTQKQFILFEC